MYLIIPLFDYKQGGNIFFGIVSKLFLSEGLQNTVVLFSCKEFVFW